MSEGSVTQALDMFSAFAGGMTEFLIAVMKVHPIMGPMVWNWMMNMGFAMTNEWSLKPGEVEGGEMELVFKDKAYDSKLDLVAQVFRESAKISGTTLTAENASKIFSINIAQVLGMLK